MIYDIAKIVLAVCAFLLFLALLFIALVFYAISNDFDAETSDCNTDIVPDTAPALRLCRICGCSDEEACYLPHLGNCWWMEHDLCSHCVLKPGEAMRYNLNDDIKNINFDAL